MSTDQQPAPYDPRYDGIYQRGGASSMQSTPTAPRTAQAPPTSQPARTAAWSSTPPGDEDLTVEPRQAPREAQPVPPSSYSSPAPPGRGDGTASSSPSIIREVGAPPAVTEPRARNPFDVWVWAVAALLTALGTYFISAPIMLERANAEAMMAQSGANTMYIAPWYNYTMHVAPTLVLLGVGTAVVQLFILSLRHTFRSSPAR